MDHVGGAVFDADDAGVLEGAFGGGEGDGDLGEGGHVVEEEGERDGRGEGGVVAVEVGWGDRKVERRGGDDSGGTGAGGEGGEGDGFREGSVGDADDDGDAVVDDAEGFGDDGAAEGGAETGGFAGAAEDEEPVDAAEDEVFDETFEGGDIELVGCGEGCGDGGDDAVEARGRGGRHGWRSTGVNRGGLRVRRFEN